MDPAQMGDGSCANPQGSLDSNGNYNMGGSDGQLVKVDPANDRIYLTFQCVGNYFTTDNSGKITLTTKLNKTLLAVSSNQGASWQSMGFIDLPGWRFGILPMTGRLAFGVSNNIIFGTPSFKQYAFSDAHPLTGQYGGFNWNPTTHNFKQSPDRYISSYVWANTVIARAGESNDIMFAFPTIIGTGSTAANGYSVFFYDPQNARKVEIPAVTPLTHSPSNFLMFFTAIDLGSGPVLLYWMDVNTSTHKARIRGRVIINTGQYSSDFDISNDIDLTLAPTANNIDTPPAFFYGDYHTASGYTSISGNNKIAFYRFYPFWVDRIAGAQYAVVSVSETSHVGDGKIASKPLSTSIVTPAQWIKAPPTVKLVDIRDSVPRVSETHENEGRRINVNELERTMPTTPRARPTPVPRSRPKP